MATDTAATFEDAKQKRDYWSGAKSPFDVSYGKIMMWYFLLSDAFTFAGFLISYGALRFSTAAWPVPDFVFSKYPGLSGDFPLLFVTFMTFVLLFSSFTMMRAVQEGHRENKKGVVFWMTLTIIGGTGFLGCQAWEWSTLIGKEHLTVTKNPFGTHTEAGVYLASDGSESNETFDAGSPYLIHKMSGEPHGETAQVVHGDAGHGETTQETGEAGHHADYPGPGNFDDAVVTKNGFILKKFKVTEGPDEGVVKTLDFGPKAFGALFFFITGFHGFHVFSGVVFLLIILINAASGIYAARKNGHEMVEKIGLYWHFVDLVWVFVFLVFYLL